MAEVSTLESRIDSEFAVMEGKVKQRRAQQVDEYKERQARLAKLTRAMDDMRPIWQPRLETLARRFGDKVQVTPSIEPATRQATFTFQSKLASVQLRFGAAADADARHIILSYDLRIIPTLMEFVPHAELKLPLEPINKEAVAKWIDDRIVDFVRTYLAMGECAYYLKDHMVEDPIAHVQLPDFAAAATIEVKGKTYYFISDETRKEFELKMRAGA